MGRDTHTQRFGLRSAARLVAVRAVTGLLVAGPAAIGWAAPPRGEDSSAEATADPAAAYARIVDAIEHGELDRAQAQLDATDLSPGARARAEGQLAAARGDFDAAVAAFERALAIEDDAALRVHLARARVEVGDFDAALDDLDRADANSETTTTTPSRSALRARAQLGAGQRDRAWATLAAAVERHPEVETLRVEWLWLAMQLEWPAAVRSIAGGLVDFGCAVDDAGRKQRALGAVAVALGGDRQGLEILERASLCAPGNRDLRVALARSYLAAGHLRVAARQFERAGAHDEAAATWLRAGDLAAAQRANLRAPASPDATQQRLEILFAGEQWARTVAHARAHDAQLRGRARAQYLLAYAHFRLHNYARATERARALLDGPLAADARALLEAMGRGRGAER